MLNPYLDLFRRMENQSAEFKNSIRKRLIWAFSWAVPNDEAIQAIAACGSSIVEVGAGTGYWAWLLGQAGCIVRAFDREPNQPPRWSEIDRGGSEVLRQSDAETLLLCWPPYQDAMAFDCLMAFRGRTVAYVGEGYGGRTGNDAFHAELERTWKLERTVAIPQWPGFHDRLWLYSWPG